MEEVHGFIHLEELGAAGSTVFEEQRCGVDESGDVVARFTLDDDRLEAALKRHFQIVRIVNNNATGHHFAVIPLLVASPRADPVALPFGAVTRFGIKNKTACFFTAVPFNKIGPEHVGKGRLARTGSTHEKSTFTLTKR